MKVPMYYWEGCQRAHAMEMEELLETAYAYVSEIIIRAGAVSNASTESLRKVEAASRELVSDASLAKLGGPNSDPVIVAGRVVCYQLAMAAELILHTREQPVFKPMEYVDSITGECDA